MRDSARLAETANGPAPLSGKFWRHDHALLARVLIMAALLSTLVIFFAGSIGIAEVLTRLLAG